MLSCVVAAAQMAPEQIIWHNIGKQPTQLDPALATSLSEMNTQLQVFEGLTRVAADGSIVTGTAKSWELLDNGTRYIFRLRTAAKWSNGDPITAYDFEYAWKRLLDPATGAEYADQGYIIKNGAAYNTKKIANADLLGVKALDQWTLEVVLEAPAAYFLSLIAYPPFFPVHRTHIAKHGHDWASNPTTNVGNGPFKMTQWVPDSQIEFEKNPHYWDAANVKLEKLVFTITDDEETELNMWEAGQIDSTHAVPAADIQRLHEEGKLTVAPDLGNYFYMFNTAVAPLNDARVRKALTMAIDRSLIVEHVIKGGQVPAYAFVPFGMPDSKIGDDFRTIGGDYFTADLVEARRLLSESGYPDGNGFPTLNILYNTSVNHEQIAAVIQELWQQNLGIEVTLTSQEWDQFLQSREQGDYQIARSGWASDYRDAQSFLDLWVTTGDFNDSNWSHKEYDQLLDIAKSTSVAATRIKALHDAEQILMSEMPVMPIYFLTRPYLQSRVVQGVVRSPLGYVDFKAAWRAAE